MAARPQGRPREATGPARQGVAERPRLRQLAATGIGTVGAGVLQSAGSGSGTAEGAAPTGSPKMVGSADSTLGPDVDPDTDFATATVFGIGLDASRRVLSARVDSARSRALWGMP